MFSIYIFACGDQIKVASEPSTEGDILIDEDGDGKRELVLLDEVDSTYTISFEASQKVYPGYNVMGTAKAALENFGLYVFDTFIPLNLKVTLG